MKVFLAVIICKILYFIGKQVGKGSSLPGKIVLRLFPDVLGSLKLPETIIAVTGSNGKTTTTELIVQIFKANGKKVGWNHEGSNQTEGVATLLLRVASFSGRVKSDVIVMECDERYAVKIFEKVKPSVLLVTNLCRDQLTRNGHPEFIEDCIRVSIEAAGDEVLLVLNADDPYVAALATPSKVTQGKVLWFGISPKSDIKPHIGMYDDGAFCPVCKARMTYDYRIVGHYGKYKCLSCDLKRNETVIEATLMPVVREEAEALTDAVNQKDGNLIFNTGDKTNIKLPSITGAYNYCAAVATANATGVSVSDGAKALDGYKLTSGRVIQLSVGDRSGLLLLSKHENSFAYDCSLQWIAEQKKPCTVIVLVDAISRKYYTSETSWFWDIDFDLLTPDYIKNIVLAGQYVNELTARFAKTLIKQERIGCVLDLNDLREYIEKHTTGDIYAVTCFSDKVKLLKALE